PLSLLLWTLLSCSFFLTVGVARAFSRRTVTAARSPALIVPSVDGFRVILWFACAVRHVRGIIRDSPDELGSGANCSDFLDCLDLPTRDKGDFRHSRLLHAVRGC